MNMIRKIDGKPKIYIIVSDAELNLLNCGRLAIMLGCWVLPNHDYTRFHVRYVCVEAA